MPAQITATSFYLPPDILDNGMLAAFFPGTSDEQIFKMCGVRSRHVVSGDIIPSDLAFEAANALFSDGYEHYRKQIDALIFCSEGLDYKAPATACILHDRLRLNSGCLSIDLPGGCTGFINGLQVAKGLLAGHEITNVLLLTAEAPSKVIHDNDLGLRMIFGDAGCATLVSKAATDGMGNFISGTDGSGKEAIWIDRSGARSPADIPWLEENRNTTWGMRHGQMRMQGDMLLHFALSRVPQLLADTLAANQLHEDDIDLYIFHQASKIILKSLQRKCRIPKEKFYLCYENFGNTVSASIPLALHHAMTTGVVRPGSRVLLAGFGIGLSWGATVIRL